MKPWGVILLLLWHVAALILVLAMGGCSFINGLEQFKYGQSVPAYPPEIADQAVIWHEGGKIYVIDKTGSHEIK